MHYSLQEIFYWEGASGPPVVKPVASPLSSQFEAMVHWEGVASSPPVVKLNEKPVAKPVVKSLAKPVVKSLAKPI